MQYLEYGKTGKTVSALGFGGMRFDTENRSHEQNAELVRYASSKGVTYFDTAPGYCGGDSEIIFGKAFKDMPGDWLVSTKGMPVFYDTADKARDAVRESLDRMEIDKIHFYHVWCLRKMEHYELAMKPGGQYEGLLRCQEEGLIDHIVCSSHQTGDGIRKVLGKGEFAGCLMGVNVLNFPYRWDGVEAANELGLGVVAMNPLAGGAIPQNEEQFAFLAREGETPTEAALRFNIACPQITISLVGFTTEAQVDTAVKVADTAEPMGEAELARIREHLGENLNEICTGCGYCDQCPQNIPVPSYMQYYNGKAMFGHSDEKMIQALGFQHDWGLLADRKADADACVECGVCEETCTQHLPIIDRLKEIAEFEARFAEEKAKQ